MNSTDRILSNISAIKTMLENFPHNLLDNNDGKVYTSAIEFIIDLLKSCGLNDEIILDYLIGKIYGFEGQPGYTINGLYELLKSDKLTVNPQNEFVSFMEQSIKVILMSLFTNLFTCSALPVLPNKVFDYDSLKVNGEPLMPSLVSGIVMENETNDYMFKLKYPVSLIDITNMLSISPTTSQGRLYYTIDGSDSYFKKELVAKTREVLVQKTIELGETYKSSRYKYDRNIAIILRYNGFLNGKRWYIFEITEPLEIDLEINVAITPPNDRELIYTLKTIIYAGDTEGIVEGINVNPYEVSTHTCATIHDITFNGVRGGAEVDIDDKPCWIYLYHDSDAGFGDWEYLGGEVGSRVEFGEENFEEETFIETATTTMNIQCLEDEIYHEYEYVKQDKRPSNYVRYVTMPTAVDELSPEYIACYYGQDPSSLYKSYDMNAFIWYVLQRGSKASQSEKNHLMWDNRISASKNGFVRGNGKEWNEWYSSKQAEGEEFNDKDGYYPIIQLERYLDYSILVRIPAQRYYAPKKREELLNNTFSPSPFKKYFNSSIYRFDWEYLQNIQILNPRLLLVRFIEHVYNLALSIVHTQSMGLVKNEIQAKLSAAIKNIIEADDMEVEDCYNVFSNQDFDDLLNEMLTQRYTATKYNGEVNTAREMDVNEITSMLDSVNSNATTAGNVSKIKRLVNDISVDPGIEPSTEWNFEYKMDSNFLKQIIWAVVMPIVESLFTPQVMLLVMINFDIMGIVNIDEALGNNFGKIANLLINQILSFVKSIIKVIKNKILELLLKLLVENVMPFIIKYRLLLYLEQLTNWLVILGNAVKCLPLMMFSSRGQIGYIDNVDYADIIQPETIPESDKGC